MITLSGLTTPYSCACHKLGHRFSTLFDVVSSMFKVLRGERIARFVDIE